MLTNRTTWRAVFMAELAEMRANSAAICLNFVPIRALLQRYSVARWCKLQDCSYAKILNIQCRYLINAAAILGFGESSVSVCWSVTSSSDYRLYSDECDFKPFGERNKKPTKSINPLSPSGYYMYHMVWGSAILRSAHTVYLSIVCGSQNKQRLFPYTTLTDWFL
jgi:hypothetical protein